MRRIEQLIVGFCSIGVALSFLVLIAAVLTQVIGRTIGTSPVWTEELTRFAMLYMVAFGAGLAFRSGDLVNVDIVCEALPGAWPWRLRLLCSALMAGLCLFLIPAAWKYVSIGAFQTSPALGLRMDIVHFSVFALLVGLAGFAVLRVVVMLFARDSGQPLNRLEM